MNKLITIPIDWAEYDGWKCVFCGGEIDHLHEERYEQEGYVEDSYTCQDKNGSFCEIAYFVVKWSLTKRDPSNGDALTLSRRIELEIDGRYVNGKRKQAVMFKRVWVKSRGNHESA